MAYGSPVTGVQFTVAPPVALPMQATIQTILPGMILDLAEARARVLEELLERSVREGHGGVWVCGAGQQGIDPRIPAGELWDITALGSIENLRYYVWDA